MIFYILYKTELKIQGYQTDTKCQKHQGQGYKTTNTPLTTKLSIIPRRKRAPAQTYPRVSSRGVSGPRANVSLGVIPQLVVRLCHPVA